jgi:hypothetical protein
VVQSPGRAGEDDRGGFTRGGWAAARSDEEVAAALQNRVMEAKGMRLLHLFAEPPTFEKVDILQARLPASA